MDCRNKISILSNTRLELVELQKKAIRQEMVIQKQEFEAKMIEHNLKTEQQKLELLLLKKQLDS